MSDLAAVKAAARAEAFARRKVAFTRGDDGSGAQRLLEVLEPWRGAVIAGYMPMRTEIDPLPAMADLARDSTICVPVIAGKGMPLVFHRWSPTCAMIDGPFGARVPAEGVEVEPHVLIVPLVAFDRAGNRLGYGGGFYDRTLEGLRRRQKTVAIGFAWAAQEAGDLPLEPTDQPLDMVVTEAGVLRV